MPPHLRAEFSTIAQPKVQAPPVYRPQAPVSQPKVKPVNWSQSGAFMPPHLRAEFSTVQAKSGPGIAQQRLSGKQSLPSQARAVQPKSWFAPAWVGVVQRHANSIHSGVIQCDLAEGETAIVTQNENATFTGLDAGCMAITVCFTGGGGAALHMAMLMDNANQWADLEALVADQDVSRVHLDSDFIGNLQGWYVKEGDYTVGPRAFGDFPEGNGGGRQIPGGWVWQANKIKTWFAGKFNIASGNVMVTSDTQNVSHLCP